MLMQLGFEKGFFDSSLEVISALDGDIVRAERPQISVCDARPVPGLGSGERARAVPGVATARPLYADWYDLFWKNPFDGKLFLVRAFGFAPDRRSSLLPKSNAQRAKAE